MKHLISRETQPISTEQIKRSKMPSLQALMLMALTALSGSGALADPVEDFYKNKTITLAIGYSPGGTDDVWARLVAKYMPKYLPGHPNIVSQNVPGAGSLLLTNQLYNTQPKDGTVMGLINRGVPFEPLLGGKESRFDAMKFNYIGSPDRDILACVVRNDAPVQKLDDLLKQEMIVGATGAGADSQTYPEILSNLLKLKIKIVNGYPGSRDILLAVERNEVHGGCVSYDTVARDAMFRDKRSHVLFQAALESDSRIPDVPLVTNLAQSENEKLALRLFMQRSMMGRPFVAPPGVPAERIKALQDAFAQAMKDPDFIEEAKKSNVNIHYVSPAELLGIVKEAYDSPAPVVELTKKAFGRQ